MNSTNTTTQILKAVEELNQQLPPEQQVPVSSDTLLFGHEGLLDSLGLVSLILIVEERVASEFGVSIALADERAMSQTNSPFRSVQSLTEYVSLLMHGKQNG